MPTFTDDFDLQQFWADVVAAAVSGVSGKAHDPGKVSRLASTLADLLAEEWQKRFVRPEPEPAPAPKPAAERPTTERPVEPEEELPERDR